MSAQFYVFISMFGTYFRSGLGVGPDKLAFAASYAGAIFAGMSAFIVPGITRRVPLDQGLVGAILLVSLGRFAVFFWGDTYVRYLVISTIGVAGQATYLTFIATAVQAAAPAQLRATVGGTAQLCETVASVILPAIAGSVVETFGPFSHFLFSGSLALLAVVPASFVNSQSLKHE
ncbi:unnamed protein product [Polarella glacialis]|uniref:Major facilitator superfamily (MFS) profile domain-containing protein n=1 Tax=Polarella glacialis TaxID=89957 RepID=A0A813HB82_POLGL|nr:unnamed protein product [Polarella glacialis]